MKYLKYLTLVLFVGLLAACSDKDVTYDMEKAGSNKAFVQVFNMAPIANNAANYAFKVDLNGATYVNDMGSLLLTRNGIPSGQAGLFYAVDAGKLNIKLYKKENVTYEKAANGSFFYVDRFGATTTIANGDIIYAVAGDNITRGGEVLQGAITYNGEDLTGKIVRDSQLNATERYVAEPYYDQTTEETLEAGKHYQVVIHNLSGAPKAIEFDEIPSMKDVTQTWADGTVDVIGEGSFVKFVNFLYESPGVPYPGKLQVYFKNAETGAFDIKVGEPFGFGEACKWAVYPFKKSIYNSSGYARGDYNFHVIDANGADLGVMQYKRANGAMADWTDYWSTYYVGRAYTHFLLGYRNDNSLVMVNARWTSK